MSLLARFPRLAAWVIALALVGAGTLCALQGLRALEPGAPPHLDLVHGIIVAIQPEDRFALRMSGHPEDIWFRLARGAPVSMAHIQRHLRERAPTDVYYLDQERGPPLVWIAD